MFRPSISSSLEWLSLVSGNRTCISERNTFSAHACVGAFFSVPVGRIPRPARRSFWPKFRRDATDIQGTGYFHGRWIARTSMRLHIQGLQRIASVTKLEISSMQASHYPTAAFAPCTEAEAAADPRTSVIRSAVSSNRHRFNAESRCTPYRVRVWLNGYSMSRSDTVVESMERLAGRERERCKGHVF